MSLSVNLGTYQSCCFPAIIVLVFIENFCPDFFYFLSVAVHSNLSGFQQRASQVALASIQFFEVWNISKEKRKYSEMGSLTTSQINNNASNTKKKMNDLIQTQNLNYLWEGYSKHFQRKRWCFEINSNRNSEKKKNDITKIPKISELSSVIIYYILTTILLILWMIRLSKTFKVTFINGNLCQLLLIYIYIYIYISCKYLHACLDLSNTYDLTLYKVDIYPTPLLWVTPDQFSSGVKLVWIQFSFSKTSFLTKTKEHRLLNYLSIAGGEEMDLCLSQRVLAQREMQTASSRILTYVTDFIPYNYNFVFFFI